jgi:hypothetical protein
MKADPVVGRSRMGDIEDKLGIDRLDLLMAERAQLVEQVATLRARHGTFGLFDHERKVELARLAGLLRAQAVRDKVPKPTAAEIDDGAHCHPDYMSLVTQATIDRANLYRLESRITDINDLIQRGNVLARFAAQEARL